MLVVSSPPNPIIVKLADFGCSKHAGGNQLGTQAGTMGYMAPEILDRRSTASRDYSFKVDLWSLGCLIYAIFTKSPPLQRLIDFFEYTKENGPFPTEPLVDRGASDQGIQFIRGLMAVLPANRLSAPEALQHPWITSGGEMPPVGPDELLRVKTTGTPGSRIWSFRQLLGRQSNGPSSNPKSNSWSIRQFLRKSLNRPSTGEALDLPSPIDHGIDLPPPPTEDWLDLPLPPADDVPELYPPAIEERSASGEGLDDVSLRYKLQTEFFDDYVVHTHSRLDAMLSDSERWTNIGTVGSGGFGAVHLQQSSLNAQLRAVKRIATFDTTDSKQEVQCMIAVQEVSCPLLLLPPVIRVDGLCSLEVVCKFVCTAPRMV